MPPSLPMIPINVSKCGKTLEEMGITPVEFTVMLIAFCLLSVGLAMLTHALISFLEKKYRR